MSRICDTPPEVHVLRMVPAPCVHVECLVCRADRRPTATVCRRRRVARLSSGDPGTVRRHGTPSSSRCEIRELCGSTSRMVGQSHPVLPDRGSGLPRRQDPPGGTVSPAARGGDHRGRARALSALQAAHPLAVRSWRDRRDAEGHVASRPGRRAGDGTGAGRTETPATGPVAAARPRSARGRGRRGTSVRGLRGLPRMGRGLREGVPRSDACGWQSDLLRYLAARREALRDGETDVRGGHVAIPAKGREGRSARR